MVKDLLKCDMIEAGNPEWRAPLMVVLKPDGSWRVVVDYRGLNELTIPDTYPMPLISEILFRLSGAKFFTKMDLTKGFWHIHLAEESKEMTSFAIKGATYVWKCMPMGLKNSPATFQWLMDDLLKEFSDFCQPYIDDVIIFSKTFEEHCKHLELVMTKLREAGIVVKLPKCEFAMDKMDFLGHTVSAERIQMQHRKIKAISKMQPPRNAAEMKRFLAMAGYYRKFIKDFARKTHYMSELCRKGVRWE
jgi:hypothetical protein